MSGKPIKFAVSKIFAFAMPLILLAASQSVAQTSPATASMLKKSTAGSSKQETPLPRSLSPQEVDAHLATMDDVQVRRVLAQKLRQESELNAIATAKSRPLDVFYRFAERTATVIKKIGSIFSAATERSDQWDAAIHKL